MKGNNFRYLLKNKTPCNSSKISKFQPSTFFKSKQHYREFWCLIIYAHGLTENGKKVNSVTLSFSCSKAGILYYDAGYMRGYFY